VASLDGSTSAPPAFSAAAAHLARSPRTAVVWGVLLRDALATYGRSDDSDHHPLDVVDVGGGTGGFAVPLAEAGHRVTVVDPSPDALASLLRRAGETGAVVHAVQGDAAGLLDVVAPGSADLVLCHGVLEHVDEVRPAVESLVAVLRPGGTLSVLVAHRNAAVVARTVAGHYAEARHALADPDGRWGPGDPLPRRFTEAGLLAVLAAAGLEVGSVHGVRTLADLAPATDAEADPAEELVELELATAGLPEFRAVASQLHVLASRV
jgi:S-adenosylmethionine-dependent methyltransferase